MFNVFRIIHYLVLSELMLSLVCSVGAIVRVRLIYHLLHSKRLPLIMSLVGTAGPRSAVGRAPDS